MTSGGRCCSYCNGTSYNIAIGVTNLRCGTVLTHEDNHGHGGVQPLKVELDLDLCTCVSDMVRCVCMLLRRVCGLKLVTCSIFFLCGNFWLCCGGVFSEYFSYLLYFCYSCCFYRKRDGVVGKKLNVSSEVCIGDCDSFMWRVKCYSEMVWVNLVFFLL